MAGVGRGKPTGEYNYRAWQPKLRLFWQSPSPREIAAVNAGPADFGLLVEPPLIGFLYHFEGGCSWSDASYSFHRVPLEEQLIPESARANDPDLLVVILVDAATGIIRALRVVTFSPPFTALLRQAIRAQAAQPFDQPAYEQAVQTAYRRYPDTDSMVRAAVIVERGGRL
ncbi:MAG: hypothetical protein U1F76_21025 [Candidatus Competibacteraceae bacterium]